MIDSQSRRLFAIASLALRYPERDWLKRFEEIEDDLQSFDLETRKIVWKLITHFSSQSLLELQMEYVKLFDRKHRACLYLSYYLNGDTRRRGMALLDFKNVFSAEGFTSKGDELDDFFPTLLEFLAVSASETGLQLLSRHKAGVALLSIALRDMGSPYAEIVKAVLDKIPGNDHPLTLNLIAEGPPIEMVGLSPYGSENNNKMAGAQC